MWRWSKSVETSEKGNDDPAAFKGGPPEVWLREAIAADIKEFGDAALQKRNAAFRLRIAAASFGAATTVAIGLQSLRIFENSRDYFALAALLFSALVIVANAWEAFFDYRWDWVRFKETYAKLYGLLYQLNFENAKSEKVDDKKLDEICRNHIETIVGVNANWAAHRSKPGEQS
jgi:Protein of unknown function (DUF4231)